MTQDADGASAAGTSPNSWSDSAKQGGGIEGVPKSNAPPLPPPSTGVERNWVSRLPGAHILRGLWASLIITIAIVVWFVMSPGPHPDSDGSWESQLQAAETLNRSNDARADSAPQQQVVNGWYANDLARIQAQELAAQHDWLIYGGRAANRTAAMTVLLVIAIGGETALRGFERLQRR